MYWVLEKEKEMEMAMEIVEECGRACVGRG